MFRPPRGRLFTIPMIWSGNPCSPISETLYPSSSDATGEWGANPHSDMDNNSDAEFGETTELPSAECAATDVIPVCELLITNPTGTPADSSCQGLKMEVRFSFGEADCPGCGDGEYRLFELTTARTPLQTQGSLTCSFASASHTLSTNNYDAITNHNNLQYEIGGNLGVLNLKDFVTLRNSFARLVYFAK